MVSLFSISKTSLRKVSFFFVIILISCKLNIILAQLKPSDQFIVVIDPGHGGEDPGATRGKIQEKDIVLSIAKKLGKLIEAELPDIKLIYTRKTDVFIPLHERAAIANRAKADLFVSIHADAVKNTIASGSSVFVIGLHKNNENLEVAKRENAVITREDDYLATYDAFDNSTESYIKFSLMQNLFIDQSIDFAAKVRSHFIQKVRLRDRGVQQAGFLVLWKSAMPSVLIETGFVSNPEEAKFLTSQSGQDTIARAIFHALHDYKESIDRSTLNMKEVKSDSPSPDSFTTFRKPGPIETKHKEISKPDTVDVYVKEDKSENELHAISSIIFVVQVCSSPVKINAKSSQFKGIAGVKEVYIDGAYKYSVGEYTNIKEAELELARIKKKIKDAFIVAYRNGKKIPLTQARNELKG